MNTNPNSDNRSTNEAVVRVVATHIFALLNYGHFGSLLAGYVVIFLFYPTVIIAQIVFGIAEAINYCTIAIRDDQDGPSADLSFYVQGALGVRALVNGNNSLGHEQNDQTPVPLFRVGHMSLRRTTTRMSWKLLGRVIACLVALTQSIASTIIFIRRMEHGDYLIADVLNWIAAFRVPLLVLRCHCGRRDFDFRAYHGLDGGR
jgi:hypothetical protein